MFKRFSHDRIYLDFMLRMDRNVCKLLMEGFTNEQNLYGQTEFVRLDWKCEYFLVYINKSPASLNKMAILLNLEMM